ncbi:MAG TPA: hypothetical protein VGN98_09245 [Tianweitania sediminis]|jgi:hypothetical protein|nr:hypothetical protein [Tianweitania sediminis]
MLKRLIGYGFLALLLAQIGSCAPSMFRTLIAAVTPMPELGDPPYRPNTARGFSASTKAALARFPDLDSCLFHWGDQVLWDKLPEDKVLRLFAWNSLANKEEAEVCLFRLLSYIGDIDRGLQWFESQGFQAMKLQSSNRPPYISASWSIAARGRAFGESLFEPPWNSFPFPYGMSLSVEWMPDGKKVDRVQITYSTL